MYWQLCSCLTLTDSQKLQDDLVKVEQLETKITDELSTLRERIDRMQDELTIYSDLEQLKQDADDKKKVRMYFKAWGSVLKKLLSSRRGM